MTNLAIQVVYNPITTTSLRSDTTTTIFSLHVFVQLLFEGSVYCSEKPTCRHQWRLDRIQLFDAVSSTCSLSVLLSVVEMRHSYNTSAIPLTHWSSSEIICLHVRGAMHYTSWSYYSRVAFISLRGFDCEATIQGWRLFKVGVYMTKYGIHVAIVIVICLLY